jgi:3-hydroxybutyryl-CoA dehydrogenase
MDEEGIKKICSLGTGTIGPAIALTFALAGYEVQMYGRSEGSVKLGLDSIINIVKRFNEKDIIPQSEIPEVMDRIRGVTSLEEAVEDAGFIVEAIIENLAAKQEIFARIEKICSADTILASSTSGLSPTSIAENLEHKERFIVVHFWNPPHLIPLVEVVPGNYTSPQTTALTSQILAGIGKKPVVLNREALGFIGNRLQFAMLREGLALIEAGIASKEAVDATMKYALGRRLSTTGPFESADLSGLDIINDISAYLMEDLCSSPEVSPVLSEIVAKGRLGAKTKAGFYDWTPDSLQKVKQIREENLMEWVKKDQVGYLDWSEDKPEK